jgi:GGDEF domain-containing protein
MDKNRRSVQLNECVDQVGHTTDHTPQHHDRLTWFGDRHKLIADLTDALKPGSLPSVLAVFALAGSADYRRVFGERASDELIARLAERFTRVLHPAVACYRPRLDEFCALIRSPIDDVQTMIFAAEGALNNEAEPPLITAWFGTICLPDEAADPTEALILADERLRVRMVSRQPRERRQNTRPS